MTAHFDDEFVRVKVDYADSRELDETAKERGVTRGQVVAGIVAGAIEAGVADDLLDLARQTPNQPASNAPGGAPT